MERLRRCISVCKGQAAPEMGRAFARARELWEQSGSPSEFLHIPYGQSIYHMYRGEFDLARRLDSDLLHLSRRARDFVGLVLVTIPLVETCYWAGKFASSRSHFEEVLALYNPISHRELVHHTGSRPHVIS